MIFDNLYSVSQPGIKVTCRLISKNYVWSGHKRLDTQLSTKIKSKSSDTYEISSCIFSCSWPSVRHHWSTYLFFSGILLPHHLHWQIYPLAWNNSTCRHVRSISCTRFHFRLGQLIWWTLFMSLFFSLTDLPYMNSLECLHSLKESLKTVWNHTPWCQNVPLILLGLRKGVKSDIQSSSAELLYNKTICLPGQLIIILDRALLKTASLSTCLRMTQVIIFS